MMTEMTADVKYIAYALVALATAMSPCSGAQVIAETLAADLEPAYECDVCVLGGGPSGTAAAIAATELPDRAPGPARLPDRLRGQYWSDPLARLVGRGAVGASELAELDPLVALTEDELRRLLLGAFPDTTTEQLDAVPAPADPDALTRAELAMYLWEAIRRAAE